MQPFQIRNFYGFHADMLSQPRAAFDSRGLLYIVRYSLKVDITCDWPEVSLLYLFADFSG